MHVKYSFSALFPGVVLSLQCVKFVSRNDDIKDERAVKSFLQAWFHTSHSKLLKTNCDF